MTVEEILDTKTYIRQGSQARTPREYLEPVLEAIDQRGGVATVKTGKPVANANEDDSINTSFGRVLIQADFPECRIDSVGSSQKVGFIYALDKQIPEFITYTGQEVFACTNLCVSSDEHVHNFKDNHTHAHGKIKDYLDGMDKHKEEFITFHNKLQQKELSLEDMDTTIGHILRMSIKKYRRIGRSAIMHGLSEMVKPDSMYSASEDGTNLWNVYNSITDYYSNKFKKNEYLYERPVKTKELSSLVLTLVD